MTTATIDPPRACIAPKTGLTGYKQHRCRCEGCLAANRAYNSRRVRLIAYGRWDPLVDAEPVRQHIKALGEFGIGWQRVAELARVSEGTVSYFLYAKNGRPRTTRIRRETADALLAIKASLDAMAPGQCIDAAGARRRTQALAVIGWSISEQSRRLGRSFSAHKLILTTPTVQIRTAQMVKALYDELSTEMPPPSYSVTRTRRWAQRQGWASPMAWDDDTIDNPAAQPDLGDSDRPGGYDETTVGQAAEGRLTYAQIAVHRPDLIETVRRLAKTLTDIEISHLLRWPGANDARPGGSTRAINAITKLRLDNGIPAHRRVAVIPYRQHRRKNKAA